MKSILIARDINSNGKIIDIIIEQNGGRYTPDYCSSPEDALKMVREKEYDLIVSDFSITGINGIELLQKLRESGNETPFILLIDTHSCNEKDIVTAEKSFNVFIKDKGIPGQADRLETLISAILEKKQETADCSLNEAKYKSVIDSMDDSIYVVDRGCRYLFMNNKHLERISRTSQFFSDRSYGDFHNPEESLKFSGKIDLLFSTGEEIEEEYNKNGRKFLRTITPVKDLNNEKIIAANVISKEIVEDSIEDVTDDSIYVVDRNCRYLSINISHMKRLGIDCEDLFMGRSYEEFHPKGKNERFSQIVEEVFENGEILRDEYGSEKFHFTRRFCPVFDIKTGKVIAVTVVSTNVTDQKITEKSLIEANRKLNLLNLLNSITRHDILNQMTVLLGYIELSEGVCKDEDQMKFLEKQKKAADTIHHQILFTRDYQEIGITAPSWQSISDLIRNIPGFLNTGDVVIENRCGNLKIFADPLLEKVFYNLIENSIRHGDHVSKISFYYEKIPHGLRLICEDNGTGIRNEDKKLIFKHGYGKNTGLGLFLIREILSITGLEISETGSFGKGAKFEIIVPDMMYSE